MSEPSTSQPEAPAEGTRAAPVVVGVNGSPGSWSALRYAVAEARRLDAPLHLVHVLPHYLPFGAPVPLPPAELYEGGASTLHEARTEAEREAPELVVGAELLSGGRSYQLAHAAAHAQVLVIGHDERSGMERLLHGSTATAVAARAACPVVAVPTGWPPASPFGVVLVGVKTPEKASASLEEAFRRAEATGSRLRLLHAWSLPSEYADVIESREVFEEWHDRGLRELESLVVPWRERHPSVAVDVAVEHDDAGRVLVEGSAAADEILLTRRRFGIPAGLHLGMTARHVLAHAHCPVRVVSPEPAHPTAHD